MSDLTEYLNEQMADPEFAEAYKQVSAEEDTKLRQAFEHDLATAFCAMQRSLDAGERQRGWLECLRLCAELEKLGNDVP